MNETDYIKEALIAECINKFIECVVKVKARDLAENTANVNDWAQAVIAALAIKDKVEFINTEWNQEIKKCHYQP
jgi:hypothetical protein